MTYTLRDADGFYAELKKAYGISKDWVVFKDTGGPVRSDDHCTRDDCVTSTHYESKNIPQAIPHLRDHTLFSFFLKVIICLVCFV